MIDNGTMRSEWNFDETIRGTVRGMPVQLDLAQTEEWEDVDANHREWGTTRERLESILERDTVNVSEMRWHRAHQSGFSTFVTHARALDA